MKLVKFNNGKYGICKGWIFIIYLDLKSSYMFWWNTEDRYFRDCQVDTEQEAIDAYKKVKKFNMKTTDMIICDIRDRLHEDD